MNDYSFIFLKSSILPLSSQIFKGILRKSQEKMMPTESQACIKYQLIVKIDGFAKAATSRQVAKNAKLSDSYEYHLFFAGFAALRENTVLKRPS
jgi:hypothetical protein